jgi:hypothetical protein
MIYCLWPPWVEPTGGRERLRDHGWGFYEVRINLLGPPYFIRSDTSFFPRIVLCTPLPCPDAARPRRGLADPGGELDVDLGPRGASPRVAGSGGGGLGSCGVNPRVAGNGCAIMGGVFMRNE